MEIFAPYASASVLTSNAFLTIPGDPNSLFRLANGFGRGVPRTIDQRAPTANVSALLAAGTSYHVSVGVWATSDGQAATFTHLGSLDLPEITCGERYETCVSSDPGALPAQLSLSTDPVIPGCIESQSLQFDVHFSGTSSVSSATLRLDEQPPTTLCSPCASVDGQTQPVPAQITVPDDGAVHTLVIEAIDSKGCVARLVKSLKVEEPVSLAC